jgi:hypothetical protein
MHWPRKFGNLLKPKLSPVLYFPRNLVSIDWLVKESSIVHYQFSNVRFAFYSTNLAYTYINISLLPMYFFYELGEMR